MKTILVTKPGTLSAEDKFLLREDDIVVIEADNPESVRWLKPSEIFDQTDMMRAAIYSIRYSSDRTRERFIEQLAILAKANESLDA